MDVGREVPQAKPEVDCVVRFSLSLSLSLSTLRLSCFFSFNRNVTVGISEIILLDSICDPYSYLLIYTLVFLQ